jgi:hypothetical protein
MPTRELLAPSQRVQFTEFTAPLDDRTLARFYTLSDTDLKLIRRHRRASTQLGFAVQLGYARFPGRVLRVGEEAHSQIVATLASQLGVDPAAFAAYLHGRDTTRREHQLELQRDFGFIRFQPPSTASWPGGCCRSRWAPTSGRFWLVLWSTSYANARFWLRRCRRSSGWPGRRAVEPSGSCSSV